MITDPPYGITHEPWEPDDLEAFTREWCERWSECGADFFAVFWSQDRLFEGRRWFDEALSGYHFQQVLVWHASNAMSHKSRMCFKQTWEPIFLYRRLGSKRRIIAGSKTWDTNHHNRDCYVAPVPQTNFNGEDLKQHPAQKPVSVFRWLIHALTEPATNVVDPFCGFGMPRGLPPYSLAGQYHGIETHRSTASWPRRGLPTMDHICGGQPREAGAGTSTTLPLSPDRETSPWGTTIILDLLLLAITSIDLWLRMARVGLALIRGYAS